MIVQMKGFPLYCSFISWIFQNEILDCLEFRFLCTLGSYRISSIILPHSYHVVRPVRAAAESPTRKKIDYYFMLTHKFVDVALKGELKRSENVKQFYF